METQKRSKFAQWGLVIFSIMFIVWMLLKIEEKVKERKQEQLLKTAEAEEVAYMLWCFNGQFIDFTRKIEIDGRYGGVRYIYFSEVDKQKRYVPMIQCFVSEFPSFHLDKALKSVPETSLDGHL